MPNNFIKNILFEAYNRTELISKYYDKSQRNKTIKKLR